nr:interleukin 17F1 [Gasterosteus aculeatus]
MLLVLSALLLVGLAASHRSAHGARLAGTTLRLVLDSSVQPQLGSSSASIANTSLSPWTYRESCVESRLPRQIFHAVCLTSGCLSPHGGRRRRIAGGQTHLPPGPGPPQVSPAVVVEAAPGQQVYFPFLLSGLTHLPHCRTLRQRAGKRRWTRYGFRLGTEVIAVGCTCVRPSVVTHGTNHTGPS